MTVGRAVAMNRDERIGFNEAVFREVNERVREVSDTFAVTVDEERLPLVCECGDPVCAERIELTRDRYERLRSDATLFAILPGHEQLDVEEVVERENGYVVVRKLAPDAARLAEETDPRS